MSDIDALQIKTIMKDAFNEVLNSNKDLIYNAFSEAFEDFHLLELIKDGESSGQVTREEVFEILEAK
jgi:predicted transcriptional regulator